MSDYLDPDVERPGSVIELFLRVAPKDLAAIVMAPDADTLQQAVHKLKGTAHMLGLKKLAASCRELDAVAKRGEYVAGRALVESVVADFKATCDALRIEIGQPL